MTAALALASSPSPPRTVDAVVHADRASYRRWLLAHHTSRVRYNRLQVYDAFVAQWPRLKDWFHAPLAERRVDLGQSDTEPGTHPHGGPHVLMPYLVYLSLVEGVGLDYELLLTRTFASPFTTNTHCGGLGVDLELFERHQARLAELGYSARQAFGLLAWSLGRLLLHRGAERPGRSGALRTLLAGRRFRGGARPTYPRESLLAYEALCRGLFVLRAAKRTKNLGHVEVADYYDALNLKP